MRLLGVAGFTHLCENVGELLTLPLATDVCSQASLAELQRALILRDLQQLHASLLVRSVADNLADQIAHETGVLGLNLKRENGEEHVPISIRRVTRFAVDTDCSWSQSEPCI